MKFDRRLATWGVIYWGHPGWVGVTICQTTRALTGGWSVLPTRHVMCPGWVNGYRSLWWGGAENAPGLIVQQAHDSLHLEPVSIPLCLSGKNRNPYSGPRNLNSISMARDQPWSHPQKDRNCSEERVSARPPTLVRPLRDSKLRAGITAWSYGHNRRIVCLNNSKNYHPPTQLEMICNI